MLTKVDSLCLDKLAFTFVFAELHFAVRMDFFPLTYLLLFSYILIMSLNRYQQAAEQGNHPDAQYNLGLCYDTGILDPVDNSVIILPHDPRRAVECYQHAAAQGHSDAQFRLGCAYQSGIGIGLMASSEQGYQSTPDLREAAKWFKVAAAQGHSDAQCSLAICYKLGRGVNIDFAEAIRLWKASAAQGNTTAQCMLAYCLETGQCGVLRNRSAAARWYRLAADRGHHATAQNALGCCYKSGVGVEPDYALAVKYFKLSAAQGYTAAMNNLGLSYWHGEGVDRSEEKARKWFEKARKLGNRMAEMNLRRMNGEDVAEEDRRDEEKVDNRNGVDDRNADKAGGELEEKSTPNQELSIDRRSDGKGSGKWAVEPEAKADAKPALKMGKEE